MKPHESIYRLTTDRLALRPSECIFVDSQKIHCDTAKHLGMRTIFALANEREYTLCELEDMLNEDALSDESNSYESDSDSTEQSS
uniref:Uncharacterized protein n=1 Tax=Panagrolaimus davidi TaxID=227884 RepID=A0A914PZF0_9BILA